MATPPITSAALWTWNVTGSTPTVSGYSSGTQTKTGLVPNDLRQFCTIPLQIYTNPPQPIQDLQLLNWIRYAEDWVEQSTSLLLCQTWVASPPAFNQAICQQIGITPTFSGGYQQVGYDYDLEDAGYDFIFPRAQDEGWMNYNLRYRPLRSINYSPTNMTALKNVAYIYPLLNEFFNVPWQWFVEDHDSALVRFVPATNVAMLPLFAMQLAVMGFAESVPQAIWLQYTAGLTPIDYATRFNFVKQLVLCAASVIALTNIQGTVNLGVEAYSMSIDGIMYSSKYSARGPFSASIDAFEKQRDDLLSKARNLVSGPAFTTFG